MKYQSNRYRASKETCNIKEVDLKRQKRQGVSKETVSVEVGHHSSTERPPTSTRTLKEHASPKRDFQRQKEKQRQQETYMVKTKKIPHESSVCFFDKIDLNLWCTVWKLKGIRTSTLS